MFSFVDHLCYFCLVLLCFYARLFVDALWSPAGKGLTTWLSFVMSNCDFPIGILCQVRCLIVSIPDLCLLSYFNVYVHLKLEGKTHFTFLHTAIALDTLLQPNTTIKNCLTTFLRKVRKKAKITNR